MAASLSVAFVDRCSGGGHFRVDATLNGGATQRVVYQTDDLRSPLSALSSDERTAALLILMKLHFAGRTRAQIVTEFQAGPVVMSI